MCIYKKIIGIIFLIHIVQIQICAQDLHFDVRQIINKSQLPSKGNFKAYTDWYGFVWFSTYDGLIRYDGIHFKHYTNSSEPTSIQSNKINVVIQLNKDTLLIGTNNVGLLVYSYKEDKFKSIQYKNIDYGIIPEIIWDIDIDKNNNIWISTHRGIIQLNYNLQIKNVIRGVNLNKKPTDIIDFIIDSNQDKYVVFKDLGLCKLEKNSLYKLFPNQEIHNQQYFQVVEKSKSIFLLCTSNGVLEIQKNGTLIKQIIVNNKNIPSSIMLDNNKGCYVGFINGGLYYYDFSTEMSKEIILERTQFNPTKPSVTFINKGLHNSIWIGADNYGIYSISKNPVFCNQTIIPYTTIPFVYDVSCFYKDSKNLLWIGTDGEGIIHIDSKNKESHIVSTKNGLTSNCVLSILEDRYGKIWIATWGGGLLCYDRKFETIQPVFKDIKHLLLIHDTLWIATHGSGIQLLDTRTKKIIHKNYYPYDLQTPKWGNVLLYDSKNTIWVGTALGVYKYHDKKSEFFSKELWDKDVCSLCEDKNGTIWIGTSTGLQYYDKEKKSIIKIDKKLLNVSVNAIITEGNFLYINTDKGFYKFDVSNYNSKIYTINDGLFSNSFVRNSLQKIDSLIYIGYNKGFTIYNPLNEVADTQKPEILISKIDVFDNKNQTSSMYFVPFNSTIEIPYNHSRITMLLHALKIKYPYKLEIKYMLEGMQKSYIPIDDSRLIQFTQLKPGQYNLLIHVEYENNKIIKQLQIEIKPPFWKTWWFYVYCVLLLIFSIFYYIKQKQYRMRKQAFILEQKVAEI